MRLPVVNCLQTSDAPQQRIACGLDRRTSSNRCALCTVRQPRREGAAVVWADVPDPPRPARPASPSTTYDGSDEWASLYRVALEPGTTRASFIAHLDALQARIPCGTCRAGLVSYRAANAVGDDLFGFVAGLQNATNRKLGRREWTLDEARARWAITNPSPPAQT